MRTVSLLAREAGTGNSPRRGDSQAPVKFRKPSGIEALEDVPGRLFWREGKRISLILGFHQVDGV